MAVLPRLVQVDAGCTSKADICLVHEYPATGFSSDIVGVVPIGLFFHPGKREKSAHECWWLGRDGIGYHFLAKQHAPIEQIGYDGDEDNDQYLVSGFDFHLQIGRGRPEAASAVSGHPRRGRLVEYLAVSGKDIRRG